MVDRNVKPARRTRDVGHLYGDDVFFEWANRMSDIFVSKVPKNLV
jgi:hypothetical protein